MHLASEGYFVDHHIYATTQFYFLGLGLEYLSIVNLSVKAYKNSLRVLNSKQVYWPALKAQDNLQESKGDFSSENRTSPNLFRF